MKRLLLPLLAALLLLTACKMPHPAAQTEETEPPTTVEESYIWTISLDDTKTQDHGDGISASYTVHLSASKEGGAAPLGDYRGEIRIDYALDPGADMQAALSFLDATLDAEGWGENSEFAFTVAPFELERFQQFVAAAHQGEDEALAPLLEGTGMYTCEDLQWSDSDWNMGLSGGVEGIWDLDISGDEAGASGTLSSIFGNQSVGSGERVPFRFSLHFLDESRVRLDIWSFGVIDVNLTFFGTLDKIPLSDTLPVNS